MAERDLYGALGLKRGASDTEIKKSYRKLARELHPDRNPGNATAEERFKEVAYAYQVLSDAKKRKLYDEFGEVGLKEGFDPETFRQYRAWQNAGSTASGGGRGFQGMDEYTSSRGASGGFTFNLDDLLGGRGLNDLFGTRRNRVTRGADLQSEVTLDFVEALKGTEKELAFGGGAAATSPRAVKVRLPAGVKDGGKVRLKGQGAPGPNGGRPGDLILTIHVREHPHFWRQDDDLHLNLPVTALEAYQGSKVRVPTMEGEVTLRIPPGTQSGAKLRLRGKGPPKRGGERGDLIVEVQVRLPEGKTKQIEELLEKLQAEYPADLRADIRL